MEVTQALQLCGNVDAGEEFQMGNLEQGVHRSQEQMTWYIELIFLTCMHVV